LSAAAKVHGSASTTEELETAAEKLKTLTDELDFASETLEELAAELDSGFASPTLEEYT
jgi:hypothetical protein